MKIYGTSVKQYRFNAVAPKLYKAIGILRSKGCRFAISFGPILTMNRYKKHIETGLSIDGTRNHSFVLGSILYKQVYTGIVKKVISEKVLLYLAN